MRRLYPLLGLAVNRSMRMSPDKKRPTFRGEHRSFRTILDCARLMYGGAGGILHHIASSGCFKTIFFDTITEKRPVLIPCMIPQVSQTRRHQNSEDWARRAADHSSVICGFEPPSASCRQRVGVIRLWAAGAPPESSGSTSGIGTTGWRLALVPEIAARSSAFKAFSCK